MNTIFNYCQSGNLEEIIKLITQGININQRENYGRTGRTPLYVASKFGHLDIVRYLIDQGADINIQTIDEFSTPLHIAIKEDTLI